MQVTKGLGAPKGSAEGKGLSLSKSAMSLRHSDKNAKPPMTPIKPLSRARTLAELKAARPDVSPKKQLKRAGSKLTPDPPGGPPVSLAHSRVGTFRRPFPDTMAPKGIKYGKGPGFKGSPSVKFSTQTREVEYWKVYRGAEYVSAVASSFVWVGASHLPPFHTTPPCSAATLCSR